MAKPTSIQDLKAENVIRAYSGRVGCMCGCRGRYYTAPANRAAVEADRGYKMDDRDVSARQVERILRKVQQLAHEGKTVEVVGESCFYMEESPTRCYALYTE